MMEPETAMVMEKECTITCPLCSWTTSFRYGTKYQLRLLIRRHLRDAHTEEEADRYFGVTR